MIGLSQARVKGAALACVFAPGILELVAFQLVSLQCTKVQCKPLQLAAVADYYPGAPLPAHGAELTYIPNHSYKLAAGRESRAAEQHISN